MPRQRKLVWVDRYHRLSPIGYLQSRSTWPKGPLKPDAPYEAHLARQIAENLYPYIIVSKKKTPGPAKQLHRKAQTVKKVADDTEIVRDTIYNIREGKTWPDFTTIARLEIYFDCRLWGNEHRKNSP